MDGRTPHEDFSDARPAGGLGNVPPQVTTVIAVCLAILVLAYIGLSGKVVDRVASAAGARTKTGFVALSFAEPAVAARGIPRATAVEVVVSNQTRSARTLHWSTASADAALESESTLATGAIHVLKSSSKTFSVPTGDAQPGQWFWIRLDGTSVAIKAMVR